MYQERIVLRYQIPSCFLRISVSTATIIYAKTRITNDIFECVNNIWAWSSWSPWSGKRELKCCTRCPLVLLKKKLWTPLILLIPLMLHVNNIPHPYFTWWLWVTMRWSLPANIYLFKGNNGNTRKRCEICSKLIIKT